LRIWIDAESASELEGFLVPPPIEVEPPRIGIDFYHYPVFSTGSEDPLDINVIAGPP
jgi:hypothetical protein